MSYTDKEMQISTQIAYMNITNFQIDDYADKFQFAKIIKPITPAYPSYHKPTHQKRIHSGLHGQEP